MTERSNTDPLDTDERAELLRLRGEVAKLRSRSPGAATAVPAGQVSRHARHAVRWTAVTILLILVAVLAMASVTARFTRSQILDTDRYVSTVAPLGDDPAIQAEVTNQITDEIFTRVDIDGLTEDALTALTDPSNSSTDRPRLDRAVLGLAPVLSSQAKSFVHDTVTSLVRSQQFEDLWIQANRSAHDALVAVTTGKNGPGSVEVDQSGTVSISLAAVIDKVKDALADRGFTFADQIPATDKRFVLFQSPELVKAQRAVSALDKSSAILPWLGIACVAAAVAVAPTGRRLRALAVAGLSTALGMLVLAVAILIGRALYLDGLSSDTLSLDAATAVVDTVSAPLRTSLRAVAVLGLVIAIGAYLAGSSTSAKAVRRGYGQVLNFVRRSGPGYTPNGVEHWANELRTPLRCGIIGVAALLLAFWDYPTGMIVLSIVLGAVVALVALEVLIRPARAPAPGHPIESERGE